MMSSLSHMKKVAHEVKLFEKGERVASKVSSFTKRLFFIRILHRFILHYLDFIFSYQDK